MGSDRSPISRDSSQETSPCRPTACHTTAKSMAPSEFQTGEIYARQIPILSTMPEEGNPGGEIRDSRPPALLSKRRPKCTHLDRIGLPKTTSKDGNTTDDGESILSWTKALGKRNRRSTTMGPGRIHQPPSAASHGSPNSDRMGARVSRVHCARLARDL
jgi:hypothetical protein